MDEHNNTPNDMSPNPDMQPKQNPGAMNTAQTAQTPQKKSSSMGPVMGIIIIIALLALGGLYFWGAQLNEQAANEAMEMFDNPANDDIAGSSDEPEAIEDDLNDFNSAEFDAQLEADLDAMEGEF